MINFTPEIITKARTAKSVEELMALAKENNVELTQEQANTYFAQLIANGSVADDELEAVAGGACGDTGEESAEVSTEKPAEEIDKVTSYMCPQCRGKSFGIANGKRRCSKCGYIFSNHF